MSYSALLNDTCTLLNKTTTESSSTGTPKHVWAATASAVPCALQFSSSSESDLQAREAGVRTGTLFLAYGTTVDEGYRASAFTLSPQSGLVFSITSPPVDDAGRGTYFRVSIEKVQGRSAGGR